MWTFVYPLWCKILLLWITVKRKSRKTVWGVVSQTSGIRITWKAVKNAWLHRQRGWFNKPGMTPDGTCIANKFPGLLMLLKTPQFAKPILYLILRPKKEDGADIRFTAFMVLGFRKVNWHQWSHSQVIGLEATSYKVLTHFFPALSVLNNVVKFPPQKTETSVITHGKILV